MKTDELKDWLRKYPWYEKLTIPQQKAIEVLVISVTPEVFVGLRHVHKLMAKRVYKPIYKHLEQRGDIKPSVIRVLQKEFDRV